MRKHPVILGLGLLLLIGLFFLLLMALMGSLFGQRTLTWGEHVGVVTIEGVIRDSQEISRQLNAFGKDGSIKAVVLRIDSPGGGVAPAQEIYDAVLAVKKKKKVVASMGSLAASGGYLIACAADRVVANPGTVTGSISAIMHFANAEELLKKIGLKSSVVKSGRFKDIGTPTRPMTEDEKALIQSLVDDTYDQFLEAVSKGRRIPKEDLRRIADGRVFTGRQAQKLGLVDELGDLNYTVRLAGTLSGIKGEPDVIYPVKKKSTFWELILQQAVISLVGEMKKGDARSEGLNFLYDQGSIGTP
ncbi:MAG: signal peptide peptidase SppA [Deltaproteobacteria bacterium]|nr:signal peptide peptidase SppA [Deltaproteobacteria bacterium]